VSSSDDERAFFPRTMTEAGRPLRKAAAKVSVRLIEQVDDEEEEIPENDEDNEMSQHGTKDLENKVNFIFLINYFYLNNRQTSLLIMRALL
jgi:hypothetical protein